MDDRNLERVLESMKRITPVMRKKLHRDLFRMALDELGGGMAIHHLMILGALRDLGTLSSSEVCELTGIAKSQMTHSVDKLVKLNLVAREGDLHDRRKVNIRLTPDGERTLARVDGTFNVHVKQRLSIFSDDELKRLAESFNYITDTFSRLQ